MPNSVSFFAKVDAMDVAAVDPVLADDVRMVFGNGEPMIGREAVLAGNAGFFTTIAGMSHRVLREWTVGPETVVETDVTYTRLDGKEVTLPAITIWVVDSSDRIIDLRIFADLAPVFTP